MEQTKKTRKSKDKVTDKFNKKRAKKVTSYEETIPVVKEHETIIKVKMKVILNVSYRQGIIFIRFKECDRFLKMIKEIRVSKPTVLF